jgi:hypothetical protein
VTDAVLGTNLTVTSVQDTISGEISSCPVAFDGLRVGSVTAVTVDHP